MKKLLLVILLLISSLAYSQKHYTCIGSSIAFNTPLSDIKNLIGVSIEIGNYLNSNVSIGFRTGLYSLHKNDVYSHFVIGIPIPNSNFSISTCTGYFYNYNDITLEYDINYSIKLHKNKAIVIAYSAQSAFGYTAYSLSCTINKDF